MGDTVVERHTVAEWPSVPFLEDWAKDGMKAILRAVKAAPRA